MNTSIPWEWYRTFLAVLREGSLSGASRALSITQPTAGRHIAALESALGQVLFTRSQTGLLATDTALALRKHAETMESTAYTLQRTATNFGTGCTAIRGVVRISASEVIGTEVLPPMIAKLRESHPQITIELVLSNRIQDVLHREADIAVRMTAPVQEQLIARRVGSIELGLHASHLYLARCGTPESAEDLLKHSLVGFDQNTPFIRKALKNYPQLNRNVFSMRTDSDVAQLNLIRAGAGIGICQVQLTKGDIPLQRLLPDFFSLYLDTWLVMHEDLRNSGCCKLVFDILARGLEEYICRKPANESLTKNDS
ncbi:LysR family transcriptional regulator [Leclercia pneumoniae]|uniref:LysR family transcriptional regulator n=1 Tax=Leclercia pneumoniae TaxID=2815358 RepID=UPI003AF83E5C